MKHSTKWLTRNVVRYSVGCSALVKNMDHICHATHMCLCVPTALLEIQLHLGRPRVRLRRGSSISRSVGGGAEPSNKCAPPVNSATKTAMSVSRVIFYYDVVCPFAYMASRLVEAMAQRTGAEIVWRPVLLGKLFSIFLASYSYLPSIYTPTGGIYDLIKAPQGKGGSSTETMSPAKLKIQGEGIHLFPELGDPYCCESCFFSDLQRQLARRGVPYRDPTHFPQKTVYAMRMLAGVKDQQTRIALSHDLYRVSLSPVAQKFTFLPQKIDPT